MSYQYYGPTPPVQAPWGPPPENPGKQTGIGAFIGSLFFWPAGLIVSLISFSKSRRAGMQPTGLAVAGLVISIAWGAFSLLLLAVGLSTAESTTAESEVDAGAFDETAEDIGDSSSSWAGYDCEAFADEILPAEDANPLSPSLLAVYEIETVKNRIAQYADGDLAIPEGKHEVVVLKCRGDGVFEDGSEGRVVLTATVDENDEPWYSWRLKD